MIDTLVIKFASPCNLACEYCYEYAAGDESWRERPKLPSLETLERIGHRVRELGDSANIGSIRIAAHGGEPLLAGARGLRSFFRCLEAAASPIKIHWSIQTNGTLLSPDICEVLERHRVLVGISLDGSERQNRRRIDHRGRPSWQRVMDGIALIRQRPDIRWGGLLCVVNLEDEPEETIEALCSLRPPQVDLLHPFITHDAAGNQRPALAEAFGVWMLRAMRHWMSRDEFSETRIRVFEDALQAVATRMPRTDWFGTRGVSYLVIETDGSYDLLDQLKVIGAGSARFRRLGTSVESCSIQGAVEQAERLLAETRGNCLPQACAGCRWADVCAAGHLTARHSLARGFDNPSVYCEGIQRLLDECERLVRSRMALSSLRA